MDSNHRSLEKGFALQKYLLLHSQHDALQRNMNQICASMPTTDSRSPSLSPHRSRTGSIASSDCSSDDNNSVSPLPPPTHTRHHRRTGSVGTQHSRRPMMVTRASSLPTVVDESIIGEIKLEEIKIRDVNLEIKSTLTELLNNPSVRSDGQYRMWVQSRLMDAERELRGARRRRS